MKTVPPIRLAIVIRMRLSFTLIEAKPLKFLIVEQICIDCDIICQSLNQFSANTPLNGQMKAFVVLLLNCLTNHE